MVPGELSLARDIVLGCLDEASPVDELFRKAWSHSLRALTAREKAAIAPITGHVAESVAQLILQDELGYKVVWLLEGPGTRGVDLIVLSPAGRESGRGRSERNTPSEPLASGVGSRSETDDFGMARQARQSWNGRMGIHFRGPLRRVDPSQLRRNGIPRRLSPPFSTPGYQSRTLIS
jgi:hypothetical protein